MTVGGIRNLGNQYPRSEVETWKKWDNLGFTWNRFVDHKHCQNCKFKCYTLKDAKAHSKTHYKKGGM